MQEQVVRPLTAAALEVAKMLGARQAFGLVSGRASAADAAILRQIRDDRRYLALSPNFDEFCARHLHMTRRNADKIVALLNDLGPAYFTLAQLTHITPDEFRALAPAVKDNCLEYGGEAIALVEENAARLSEALEKMREAAPASPAPAPTPGERVQALARRFARMTEELKVLAREPMPERVDFDYILTVIHADLAEVRAEWLQSRRKPEDRPRLAEWERE